MNYNRIAFCSRKLSLALLVLGIYLCELPVATVSSSSEAVKSAGAISGDRPRRLHLEPTPNPAEILVWWKSPVRSEHSVVQYGFAPDSLDMRVVERVRDLSAPYFGSDASSSEHSDEDDDDDDDGGGDDDSESMHMVLLTGLPTQRGVTVYYRVGNLKGEWSDVASFVIRGGGADGLVRIAVFGDQVSSSSGSVMHEKLQSFVKSVLPIIYFPATKEMVIYLANESRYR